MGGSNALHRNGTNTHESIAALSKKIYAGAATLSEALRQTGLFSNVTHALDTGSKDTLFPAGGAVLLEFKPDSEALDERCQIFVRSLLKHYYDAPDAWHAKLAVTLDGETSANSGGTNAGKGYLMEVSVFDRTVPHDRELISLTISLKYITVLVRRYSPESRSRAMNILPLHDDPAALAQAAPQSDEWLPPVPPMRATGPYAVQKERIKEVITEFPFAGPLKMLRLLNTERFGRTRMSPFLLFRLLRELNLDSKRKRVRFFRSR